MGWQNFYKALLKGNSVLRKIPSDTFFKTANKVNFLSSSEKIFLAKNFWTQNLQKLVSQIKVKTPSNLRRKFTKKTGGRFSEFFGHFEVDLQSFFDTLRSIFRVFGGGPKAQFKQNLKRALFQISEFFLPPPIPQQKALSKLFLAKFWGIAQSLIGFFLLGISLSWSLKAFWRGLALYIYIYILIYKLFIYVI